MKDKKIFIIALVLIVVLLVVVLLFSNKNSKISSNKIKVVTTLFPLYDISKNIGGDNAEVFLLLPPGVEAHAFEPKPSDIVKINEADIFVYTGDHMEPWVGDILKSINSDVVIVDASKNVNLIKSDDNHHEHEAENKDIHEDENHHEKDHQDEHSIDPHIWLDFKNLEIMAKNINTGFINFDMNNINFYQNNLENYVLEINKFDSMYQNTLSVCKNKNIVYGGHYAFGYLANRYNLDYLSAQGFSPDGEPTAKDLINLVNQIKKNNIKYVFYEELTSPKIAETLSGETDTKLLLLNAGHNLTKEQFNSGITLFDIFKLNLDNLKIGLSCLN